VLETMNVDYLCEGCSDLRPIGYEWDGYLEVWFFHTPLGVEAASKWYLDRFAKIETAESYDGGWTAYFPKKSHPQISILLADLSFGDAAVELCAYIGSPLIDDLVQNNSIGCVAALFFHDS